MARTLPLLLLAALGIPGAALAETGVGPADPAGAGAEGIADLYWFTMVFAAIVFLLVVVPLLVFVVRFRSRGRPRTDDGPQIHGSTRLELAWTGVPVLILVAVASFTFYKLGGINDPAGAAGSEPERIRVEGRQFYWQFEYPNGVIAVNRLRLPVDRVAELEIVAPAADVIHSFWVPNLAGKRDAIPGDTTRLDIVPQREGVFPIRCGEFCGIQHAAMRGEVEVLSEDEYAAWLASEAEAQSAGSSDLGEATFEGACATCHGLQGEGFIGLPLAGNPIVNQADTVESVVREGRSRPGRLPMPAVGQGWSDRQLEALTRYLAERFGEEGADGGSQD